MAFLKHTNKTQNVRKRDRVTYFHPNFKQTCLHFICIKKIIFHCAVIIQPPHLSLYFFFFLFFYQNSHNSSLLLCKKSMKHLACLVLIFLFYLVLISVTQWTSPLSTLYDSLHLLNNEASWCWLWTLFVVSEKFSDFSSLYLTLIHTDWFLMLECIHLNRDSQHSCFWFHLGPMSTLIWTCSNIWQIMINRWHNIHYKLIIIMNCTTWCV